MTTPASIMQEQIISTTDPTIKKDTIVQSTIDTSAITLAMTSHCSESEESSDDSCSFSDDSLEEDSPSSSPELANVEAMSAFAPRRPTSLSFSPVSNRRASSPSQRSNQAISRSARSASHCIPSTSSPRTPSISMRHDAALRAYQQKQDGLHGKRAPKSKPVMMDLTVIPKNAAPRIEIEQIFDDGKTSEEIIAEAKVAKDELSSAKANDRSAARKRMLNTLGRGQSKVSLAASESPIQKATPAQKTDILIAVPKIASPSTASYFGHQKTKSCPSPTSPYNELLGCVNVFVTPPTPQPQGSFSPILGVSISGMHRSASNDGFNSQHSGGKSLAPPPFELAPGKQRLAREQNVKALAWVASMQIQQQQMQLLYRQQQQFLLSSMQHQQPCIGSLDVGSFGIFESTCIQTPAESAWNLQTMTRAPSMAYIQQQKAVKAQQQMMNQYSTTINTDSIGLTRKSSQKSNRSKASQTSKSWWRSAAGKESEGVKSADDSLQWRRRGSDPAENVVEVRSAKPVYLPPGKRFALETQRHVLRGRA